jgi:Flp pilus assembly pilin Flp
MKSMKKFFNRFITDERGLAAVEYAIVAGLITFGLIASFTSIGTWAGTKLGNVVTALGVA